MYLYHSDTQTQGHRSWRDHEGTGHTAANFHVIYVKFFDWKSAHLMQGMLRKELKLAFHSFENCKISFTTKHGGGIFFQSALFSQTLISHRTAGEVGSYLFNSSLPPSPASQILRH